MLIWQFLIFKNAFFKCIVLGVVFSFLKVIRFLFYKHNSKVLLIALQICFHHLIIYLKQIFIHKKCILFGIFLISIQMIQHTLVNQLQYFIIKIQILKMYHLAFSFMEYKLRYIITLKVCIQEQHNLEHILHF